MRLDVFLSLVVLLVLRRLPLRPAPGFFPLFQSGGGADPTDIKNSKKGKQAENDRKMPGLPASVDLDECISRLYKKELLAESVIEAICAKTKELLMRESNVVHVRAPVTVVGDIHGQFFDLIEIFKIGGWCPDTNYLFLGMCVS